MSRLWITARPTASPILDRIYRQLVRQSYRALRRGGMGRTDARHLMSDIIAAGAQEVRP
jgi:hypothetical protein